MFTLGFSISLAIYAEAFQPEYAKYIQLSETAKAAVKIDVQLCSLILLLTGIREICCDEAIINPAITKKTIRAIFITVVTSWNTALLFNVKECTMVISTTIAQVNNRGLIEGYT